MPTNITIKLNTFNWETITHHMHEKGFAVIPKLLNDTQCDELIQNYDDPCAYRKQW